MTRPSLFIQSVAFVLVCATSFSAIPTTVPSSQPVEQIVTENKSLEPYYELQVSGGYHVTIAPGKEWKINVAGPQNAIEKLIISQGPQTLTLSPINERRSFLGRLFDLRDEDSLQYQIKINITTPSLPSIRLLGNSSAEVGMNLGIMEATLAGSSSLSLQDQNTPRFNASINGDSSLNATSIKTGILNLDLNGDSEASILSTDVSKKAAIALSGSTKINIGEANINELVLESSGSSELGLGNTSVNTGTLYHFGSTHGTINNIQAKDLYIQLAGGSCLDILAGSSLKTTVMTSGNAKFKATKDFESGMMNQENL